MSILVLVFLCLFIWFIFTMLLWLLFNSDNSTLLSMFVDQWEYLTHKRIW